MTCNFLIAKEYLIFRANFEHGFQWIGDLHSMRPSGRMKTNTPDGGVIYGIFWENGVMLQSLGVWINDRTSIGIHQ